MKIPYKYAKTFPLRFLSLLIVFVVIPLVMFGMILLYLIKPLITLVNKYYLRKLRAARNNRLNALLKSEYLKQNKDAE
jgi:Flp pilus assembly protein TadB